ncbi:hypothetical protein LTR85_001942 [Meristemomyces frigidus]|nr:hypothetical protein LTR85_001942 [Meristemomyces frigidus]
MRRHKVSVSTIPNFNLQKRHTVADTGRCYVLELPRELRNYIYDELTRDVCISTEIKDVGGDEGDEAQEDDEDNEALCCPKLHLSGFYCIELLLVNRQVHDEYAERLPSQAQLRVHFFHDPPGSYGGAWRFSTCELDFKPGFPLAWLKQTKRCLIFLTWQSVWSVLKPVELDSFISLPASDLRAQERLSWTPSKAMCEELKVLLSRLSGLLSQGAEVLLVFGINKHPDGDDPYGMIGLEDADGELPSHEQMYADQSLFHRDTLLGLERDKSIPWPRAGKLKLWFYTTTPLYCTLAANSNQVMESRRAFDAGAAGDLVLPEYKKSAESVLWALEAREGDGTWRGYWPEMLDIFTDSDCEEQ